MTHLKVINRQSGQSMVEYIIVLAFGVMVLLGPGAGGVVAVLDQLKLNYRGYSFSMSISAAPDFDDSEDYYDALVNQYGVDEERAEELSVSTLDLASDITGYDLSPIDQLGEIGSFSDVGDLVEDQIQEELDNALSFF